MPCMRRPDAIPGSRRLLRGSAGLRLALFAIAVVMSFSVPASELKFEQVFSEKGEPASLHYEAVFAVNGGEHRLEVWRDGNRRLKRRTDEAVEMYAFRKSDDPEFRLSVLDLRKRIHTRIDRTNLYRIGNFTDWFDLAHGLKHPAGDYQVARSKAPVGAARAITACDWYDLTVDNRTTHICWSAESRIPLLMQTQEGAVVWRVASLDRNALSAKTFEIHDEGFIRNDANQDIERD